MKKSKMNLGLKEEKTQLFKLWIPCLGFKPQLCHFLPMLNLSLAQFSHFSNGENNNAYSL